MVVVDDRTVDIWKTDLTVAIFLETAQLLNAVGSKRFF